MDTPFVFKHRGTIAFLSSVIVLFMLQSYNAYWDIATDINRYVQADCSHLLLDILQIPFDYVDMESVIWYMQLMTILPHLTICIVCLFWNGDDVSILDLINKLGIVSAVIHTFLVIIFMSYTAGLAYYWFQPSTCISSGWVATSFYSIFCYLLFTFFTVGLINFRNRVLWSVIQEFLEYIQQH